MTFAPQPKGLTRKRIKGRRQRHEAQVSKDIRSKCVDRDGYCRVFSHPDDVRIGNLGRCSGYSQWCHLGDLKRARTRGLPPEVRHTTAGSLQMCQSHHEAYDHGRMAILPAVVDAPLDANGTLRFEKAA